MDLNIKKSTRVVEQSHSPAARHLLKVSTASIMCLSSLCPFLSDGWAFTNNIDINQHQSLEDRLSAARILVQKEPLCPVVVDDMSNASAIKYGAMPERLYALQAGKVAYKVRAAVGRIPVATLTFTCPPPR